MPITLTIDHERRFVDVLGSGTIGIQDIIDYFDALVTQEAMGYPKLVDARQATFEISDDDMMLLGARVSAYAYLEPRGPIAMVVAGPQAENFARRFANLGGAKRAFRLFKSIDRARQWLAEPA